MSRAHIAGAAVKLHGLHWMRGRHLGWHVVMGKFDWGVRYVIIFLYVQFWIRLGTVSYRGKKVRTVDSPAVRSVNKSRDTRNCVQNEPKYAICVLVATCLYYKALRIILCALIYSKYATITIVLTMPMWSYSSPQDVSTVHGRCHGDNPWKFHNDVTV